MAVIRPRRQQWSWVTARAAPRGKWTGEHEEKRVRVLTEGVIGWPPKLRLNALTCSGPLAGMVDLSDVRSMSRACSALSVFPSPCIIAPGTTTRVRNANGSMAQLAMKETEPGFQAPDPKQNQGRQRTRLVLQSTLPLFLSLSGSVHHFFQSFLPCGAKPRLWNCLNTKLGNQKRKTSKWPKYYIRGKSSSGEMIENKSIINHVSLENNHLLITLTTYGPIWEETFWKFSVNETNVLFDCM